MVHKGTAARTGASRVGIALLAVAAITTAHASPVTYAIDPDHTHPAFEADHFGMSTWRGLFRKTRGTITLDTAAKTGSVDVTVDVASVDFGHDKLNEMAVSSSAPPILEATKFPEAHYSGRLQDFANGVPGSVAGTLTLHGIARPLSLRIVKFLCLPEHPVTKREVCGADAIATLNREDFGVTVGKKYGLDMGITLRI